MTTHQFTNTHLVIATPCYGGSVFMNYYTSILKFAIEAQKTNLKVSFLIRGGDSLIPRIRNSMTAEFLTMPGTHLLWIDADIGFEPDQIFRLLEADLDVACAIYPLKRINYPEEGIPEAMTKSEFDARYTKYPYNPIPGRVPDERGFIEVLDAPTGMMLIKRSVLDRMKQAYPGLQYLPDFMLGMENVQDRIVNHHYRFFDVMTEETGRYLSEDYAFCRRWQNIGGSVHADIHSNLTHLGHHLFTGSLYESLLLGGNTPTKSEKGGESIAITGKPN